MLEINSLRATLGLIFIRLDENCVSCQKSLPSLSMLRAAFSRNHTVSIIKVKKRKKKKTKKKTKKKL